METIFLGDRVAASADKSVNSSEGQLSPKKVNITHLSRKTKGESLFMLTPADPETTVTRAKTYDGSSQKSFCT